MRSDVGAVGAKLLFPDDTIQHAGIVIGLGAHRTAGHIHYKDENTHIGYMGRLCYAQNVSAVTEEVSASAIATLESCDQNQESIQKLVEIMENLREEAAKLQQ